MKIALIGKSGTGKSEVAKCLSENFGLKVIKTGTICRKISQLLLGNEDKASTQLLDDALTQIDPSIFLKASMRNADIEEDFVIDALRFLSDYDFACRRDILTVRVLANDTARVARLRHRGQVFELSKDGKHRSEIELDDVSVDYEIENNGTLGALKSEVLRILQRA